jgi:methyl-accepting chemotaxis protein
MNSNDQNTMNLNGSGKEELLDHFMQKLLEEIPTVFENILNQLNSKLSENLQMINDTKKDLEQIMEKVVESDKSGQEQRLLVLNGCKRLEEILTLELNVITKKAEQIETKSQEITENANDRIKSTDQKLEKVSEMGTKILEELRDMGSKIKEKIDAVAEVAKKERECLFTNANQLKQKLLEEITRLDDLMIQKF